MASHGVAQPQMAGETSAADVSGDITRDDSMMTIGEESNDDMQVDR